jgi:hypothetical protein
MMVESETQLTLADLTDEQREIFYKYTEITPCSGNCFYCQNRLDELVHDGFMDVAEPEPETPSTPEPLPIVLSREDVQLVIMSLGDSIGLLDSYLDDVADEPPDLAIYGNVMVRRSLVKLRNTLVEWDNEIRAQSEGS